MIDASLSQYLPLGDLLKIVVVCLVVAVVAPAAVSVAIVGLDRRARALEDESSPVRGDTLIVAGVLILAALIAAGLYALFNH